MPDPSMLLRAIFESSVAGIICIDSHGLVSKFSPAAERIFGYRADEVIGRNVSLLMPEPDHSRHDGYLANYARTGNAKIIGAGREVTGLRKDGTRVPLFLSIGEFEADGRRMFTGIVSDQTPFVAERLELRESEHRFRQLAESIDEVFILRTPAPYRYLYISPAIEQVFGLTADAAIADPGLFFSFTHPDDVDFVRRTMQEAQFEPGLEVEYRIVRADGETRWVWTRYKRVAVAPGEPELLAIVVSDITARKRAQEGEILAREEAERANAAKTEFLSRMSHELRTPLNAILGFTQLLEMDELSVAQQESLRHIARAGRHLLGLINEVLDIARIDAGHMSLSLEPVAVSEVIHEVISLVLPLADARGLTVIPPDEGADAQYVLADRHRITQVLLNLMSNAIKYNREDGRIVVTCEVRPDGTTSITVTDTGIGIAAEELERVFLPFDRLGRENSDIEGAGIGLALTSSLVRAMNGRIEVQSTPGIGSSFSIIAPSVERGGEVAGSPAPITPASAPDAGPPAHTSRELVVAYIEDNPANMRLMESVAARRPGVRLLQAQQGRLGLDLIKSGRPDLILLDLHLPDMSGEEMLRRLRAEPGTAHTPILIVSADASPGRVERLMGQGASGYLTKPVDVAEILAWFDRLQDAAEGGPR